MENICYSAFEECWVRDFFLVDCCFFFSPTHLVVSDIQGYMNWCLYIMSHVCRKNNVAQSLLVADLHGAIFRGF